jgi:hypothetical protein
VGYRDGCPRSTAVDSNPESLQLQIAYSLNEKLAAELDRCATHITASWHLLRCGVVLQSFSPALACDLVRRKVSIIELRVHPALSARSRLPSQGDER